MVQYIRVIDVMSNGTLVPIHNDCTIIMIVALEARVARPF